MKIIHYIPSIDRNAGGTSTYMQLLAKELGRLTELYVFTHASENPLHMENCEVRYMPRFGLFSSGWKTPYVEAFDEIKPDVVHVNCCWMPECAAVQKLAQRRGLKVVLSPHGMLEPWIIRRHYWTRKLPALMLYQKAAVVKANCIQSTADSEKENLLKLGCNNNIHVVKLGIDADAIQMKSSWAKTRKILFLSRVHVKKGINFLIEAACALKSELKGYEIIVAGEGEADYIASLEQQIAVNGLQNVVRLIGGVYGDAKWEIFKQADFFVLPTHSENFGLVIAEALASGTPVITTVGTPWEDLNTCGCGAWIEIGTQPLTETLRRFLNFSSNELEQMGKAGRQMIEEKYSARTMASEMLQVYKSI